ncbi:ribulokinase [Gallibacterium salpingitidis]|uniref:ribulokinase n=1 Tax=Gallibacterium salpingitidis TaxID=505341 RepID=UPI00266EB5E8|nr:ribulokinase [Gallibacterium salpingitidis]WKS99179.1 ribulokinase [Gallibacterium salpingitidis]
MEENKYVIGLDFGSDSIRALIVDVLNGNELGSGVCHYPRWMEGKYSDAKISQFRHHPQDYIDAMTSAVQQALSSVNKDVVNNIIGIGVDTTGSTPAPVDENGVVLALKPEFAENPNAMFILWKDHTAIDEAEKINLLAHSGEFPDYTRYVGGVYSSEWYWAKIAHINEQDSAVAKAAYTWVELADWVPALLTGNIAPTQIRRGVCAAGHKALWHADWDGLPSEEFLTAISPTLKSLRAHYSKQVYTSDQEAGKLNQQWAEKLGLPIGISVAVGAFDCHMGAVGAGARENDLVKVIGTSTCDILMVKREDVTGKLIEGICGQVEGSALPDFVALEAGQSAFGDVYAWYQRLLAWPLQLGAEKYPELKEKLQDISSSLLPTLSQLIEHHSDSHVLALDWFNGRRTPFANQHLKGAIVNMNLGTNAVDIFRCLVESTAFGAKAINDCFLDQGMTIKRIIAIGGISKKSASIMQLCSDVMETEIAVVKSDQCCALGAAIFAALAAGVYTDSISAQKAMSSKFIKVYQPDRERSRYYRERYEQYLMFGNYMEEIIMATAAQTEK